MKPKTMSDARPADAGAYPGSEDRSRPATPSCLLQPTGPSLATARFAVAVLLGLVPVLPALLLAPDPALGATRAAAATGAAKSGPEEKQPERQAPAGSAQPPPPRPAPPSPRLPAARHRVPDQSPAPKTPGEGSSSPGRGSDDPGDLAADGTAGTGEGTTEVAGSGSEGDATQLHDGVPLRSPSSSPPGEPFTATATSSATVRTSTERSTATSSCSAGRTTTSQAR